MRWLLKPTTGFAPVAGPLLQTLSEAGQFIDSWRAQLLQSGWLATGRPYYFLARGGSLGSCYEAQLLWQEGVKQPASAMTTSAFRHVPQEVVREGMRFGLWIDQTQMREQDLSVARDLRKLGASVLLIGERLPQDAADLVCGFRFRP